MPSLIHALMNGSGRSSSSTITSERRPSSLGASSLLSTTSCVLLRASWQTTICPSPQQSLARCCLLGIMKCSCGPCSGRQQAHIHAAADGTLSFCKVLRGTTHSNSFLAGRGLDRLPQWCGSIPLMTHREVNTTTGSSRCILKLTGLEFWRIPCNNNLIRIVSFGNQKYSNSAQG